MANSRICRYYLQGNCTYGSSCRFSHSNNRRHDEYEPKTNRNERNQYEDNERWNNNRESSRGPDQYEQNNYRYGNERNEYQDNRNWNNKHNNRESYRTFDQYKQNEYWHGNAKNHYHDDESWNNKHNNRESSRISDQYEQNKYRYDSKSNVKNNYNNKNDYMNYNSYENKNRHQSYNNKNDYKNYNSHENRNRYQSYSNKNDYENYNEYENKNRHQSHKDYNTNNYSKEYNKGNNIKSNYNYNNTKYNDDYHQSKYDNDVDNFAFNIKDTSSNSRINSADQLHNKYKYENDNVSIGDRNKMVRFYDKEIKSYQTHVIQLLKYNYWPFTCFHPVGYNHPVQSVGSLNLIEISFEEIRCDYYSIKNVCADPDSIHKQVYSELLSKANQQKEDIISLTDKNVDDMLITFEKCEQLKANSDLQDSIQADENSYWDMSVKRLKTPTENTNSETFSFKLSDENTKVMDELPKILMQTEVYGTSDKGFDQETFTDYIPIMPPPKKWCF